MTSTSPTTERIQALDVLRGIAVAGILLAWLLNKLEKSLLLHYRPDPNRERQNRIAQS